MSLVWFIHSFSTEWHKIPFEMTCFSYFSLKSRATRIPTEFRKRLCSKKGIISWRQTHKWFIICVLNAAYVRWVRYAHVHFERNFHFHFEIIWRNKRTTQKADISKMFVLVFSYLATNSHERSTIFCFPSLVIHRRTMFCSLCDLCLYIWFIQRLLHPVWSGPVRVFI